MNIFSYVSIKNSDSITVYEKAIATHLKAQTHDTIYIMKCDEIQLNEKVGKFTLLNYASLTLPDSISNGKIIFRIMPLSIDKGQIIVSILDYIQRTKPENILDLFQQTDYHFVYDTKRLSYTLVKTIKH